MASFDDKLSAKIHEAFASTRSKTDSATATIKEVVEAVASREWTGRLASNVLRDNGFDELADAIPYDPEADDTIKWGVLKAGAYIPDINKFKSFMPDPLHLARLFLYMHKGWTVLLSGPPSTGKTTLVEFVCALLKRPFLRINFEGTLERSDLIGHMAVQGGDMVWMDGILPTAYREGYVVCYDEIFRAPPYLPLSLQGLLDKVGGQFRLLGKHEDDVLIPHPETRHVFTDNTKGTGDGIDKYSTANVQDTSFINRIRGSMSIGYMPKDKEVESLLLDYPDCEKGEVAKLVQLAGYCRSGYMKGEMSLVLGKRQLETVCELMPFVGVREALDVVYYSSLPDDEAGAFAELYRDVFAKGW